MPVTISGSTGLAGVDGSAGTPALQGTDTNTGVYFPGADRIGFAEGGTQVGEFDDSGNFKFNSGYGSVATAYGCRAWVNFNGTGTVAIRASGNVTSITDNGTGDYTVNFTTAMPDASYAYSHAYSNEVNVQHTVGFLYSLVAGSLRVQHYNAANSNNSADKSYVLIAVFR